MNPKINIITEKKLVGKKVKMNLINNQTGVLWGSFALKIKNIKNRISTDKISMQVYDKEYFREFNPTNDFEKWAAVEVESFDDVEKELETFILQGGKYAVFEYKGSSNDNSIFQYIFTKWLPNSAYELDNRPHFEILGEKYKNNDPNSEEEIWIPIREK
ncbi:GyrI-like domain-containing protein [Bernardetia sp.]|uniref:GyrI-like domain-containing protein n=1 Tax=Bernardetia sp. TaxID=1937974 RepID=UPI0025B9A672|nr:GyrI-like domain-containing protein [Bernardetia sp.]